MSNRKPKSKRIAKAQAPKRERASIVRRIETTEIERMRRDVLDTTQSSVAEQFEALVLRSQMVGKGADWLSERVDGGRIYHEVPNHVIDCHRKLASAAKAIGMFNYAIIHKFVAEGMSARQVADHFGRSGDRAERYYRKRLQDALDELADFWFPRVACRRRASFIRDAVAVFDPAELQQLEKVA